MCVVGYINDEWIDGESLVFVVSRVEIDNFWFNIYVGVGFVGEEDRIWYRFMWFLLGGSNLSLWCGWNFIMLWRIRVVWVKLRDWEGVREERDRVRDIYIYNYIDVYR